MTERVLVTGGAGFIGPQVVKQFLHAGSYVTVADVLTYAARVDDDGSPMSLEMVLNDLDEGARSRYSFVKVDVSDPMQVMILITAGQFDRIVHMAAESHVDRSIDGKAEFINTEVFGTYALLEAIRAQNAGPGHKIKSAVFVGTDEVYGSIDRAVGVEGKDWWSQSDKDERNGTNVIQGYLNKHEFTESTPLAGGSPYAASKGAADLLVLAYFNTFGRNRTTGQQEPQRMPVCITRGVNNCGPFQHVEKLIPMCICTLLCPEVNGYLRRIPCYDKGTAIREWLSTKHYASAILFVMAKGQFGEVYNVGSGKRHSNADVMRLIWTHCDRYMPKRRFPDLQKANFDASTAKGHARPGHDLAYAINCNKLLNLGWAQPNMNLSDEIERIVSWYANNRAWWEPIWRSESFTNYWNLKYRDMNLAETGVPL
jgi:dTDP-glucose 4,6-dehydratase